MILVISYLEAVVARGSLRSSPHTHVGGLRFLILISESCPPSLPSLSPPSPPPLSFGLRSLGSRTYSWYLSIKSSPVLAITVSLFISCCGKLLWQSAVMNHLAKAFWKRSLQIPSRSFFIDLWKKNNIQFISPALSCLLLLFSRGTHCVLKVIHCKPSSFLLAGLRKANIWRV